MTTDTHERYRQAAVVFAAIIGGVIVTALLFLLIYQLRGVLPPFIYAMIIVYLLRPAVSSMVNHNIPRIVAVSVAYLVVFFLLTIVFIFLVPSLVSQVSALIDHFPDYIKGGVDYFSDLQIAFYQIKLPAGVDKIIEVMINRAQNVIVSIASGLPEATVGLFGGVFNVILAPIIAFYMLKDLPVIETTLLSLVPKKYRDEVIHVGKEIDFAVGGYLRGQLLVALAVGVAIAIWLLIIGVKFAVLLGFLAGILNIIPYFGAIVGGGIAVIVALFESPQLAILVVIGILVIQQIEGAIISPAIMRHAVNLHPLVVVLSLLIGGTLMGFLGLLLAIPIAAVGKALLLHYVFGKPVEITE